MDDDKEEWHNVVKYIEDGIRRSIEEWPGDKESDGCWRLTQVLQEIEDARKKWFRQNSQLRRENQHLQERVVALEHELAQSQDELAKSQDAVNDAQMEVIIVND
jgi:hypothetical protein